MAISATHSPGLADPPASAMRREWRDHWRIGLLGALGAAVSYGVWVNISSLFVAPLEQTFGWTRAQIGGAQTALLVGSLFAPLLGRLTDRIGVRKVLMACIVLAGALFMSLSRLNGSLAVYYAIFALCALTGLGTTGLTYARIVCAVFVGSRGLALAMLRMGLALGGALMPLVVQQAMSIGGWRAGFLAFGFLMIVVALPLVWLWAPKDRPAAAAPDPSAATSRWAALRSPKVLCLCLAVMLAYVPLFATFSQLHPMLVGKGIAPVDAGRMLGLVGVASFAGALVAGGLLDRLWAPLVGVLFTLAPCGGLALLLSPTLTPAAASAAVLLIGIGYGAEADLLGYMVARYFGLARYGALYGLCQLAIAVGAAIGVAAMGLSHDRLGSYDVALWTAIAVSVAAAACYLGMGRYPKEPAIRG